MNGGGKWKSEKCRLKLERIQIGKPLHYKRSEKVYGLENHYIIKGQKKYIDWETFPL